MNLSKELLEGLQKIIVDATKNKGIDLQSILSKGIDLQSILSKSIDLQSILPKGIDLQEVLSKNIENQDIDKIIDNAIDFLDEIMGITGDNVKSPEKAEAKQEAHVNGSKTIQEMEKDISLLDAREVLSYLNSLSEENRVCLVKALDDKAIKFESRNQDKPKAFDGSAVRPYHPKMPAKPKFNEEEWAEAWGSDTLEASQE